MNGNFMTQDQTTITLNDGAYGSNRVNYVPIVEGLCANSQSYGVGKLVEKSHKQINYDVTQKFPLNEVSAVLKSTQTELPQAHGAPVEFMFHQYPEAVEFIRSNMTEVNVTNINAGIIKELLKKYDYTGYIGINGNVGLKNNPNTVSTAAPWTDYDTLKAAIDAAVNRVKTVTSLTTEEYGDLNFTYTAGVAAILSQTDTLNLTNKEKLATAYPGMVFREIPATLEGGELFYISYRPMLTFHHASRPGQYATQKGKYGLNDETLFTFESCAVQIEEAGAVQLVTKA